MSSTRDRILAAMWKAENTFIIPTGDPYHETEVWVHFEEGREKATVLWVPAAIGRQMVEDGLLIPLETHAGDRNALHHSLTGYGTGPAANRAFLCKLSKAGIAAAV